MVAVTTGLRQGEICALTWDDIDLKKKEISVTKTLLYQKLEGDSKKNFHLNPPKTKASKRIVPISKRCEIALKKQFVQRNNIMAKQSAKPLEGFENLLFTTKFGTPICDQILYKNISVKKKYLTPWSVSCMITQVINVNEILKQALLFDFYGELLTDHQKEIYGQFLLEDLSLGEIARDAGISRQGVHDIVKRCEQALAGYEEKLHLVEKFMTVKNKVKQIDELLDEYEKERREDILSGIRILSGEIIEEL
mgnify:CR=1 FL=1